MNEDFCFIEVMGSYNQNQGDNVGSLYQCFTEMARVQRIDIIFWPKYMLRVNNATAWNLPLQDEKYELIKYYCFTSETYFCVCRALVKE